MGGGKRQSNSSKPVLQTSNASSSESSKRRRTESNSCSDSTVSTSALIIQKPWCDLILSGCKIWEVRVPLGPTEYRGPDPTG